MSPQFNVLVVRFWSNVISTLELTSTLYNFFCVPLYDLFVINVNCVLIVEGGSW